MTVLSVELTMSWEEHCEKANERKGLKYTDLMADCQDRKLCSWLFPVEVGCRELHASAISVEDPHKSRNIASAGYI